MIRCPSCQVENGNDSDNCIACGKGLYALTRGSVLSGRYEILDAIGRGGMGVVYKARDLELDEIVALKVMRGDLTGSSEGARRFRSEIKLARKVSHPNVCRIHDYGREDHLTYIVMEFIAGADLKRDVRRQGALEPREALEVILQVAQGLAAVHRQGVVHRDLKTPNIMRMPDGTAKLMDFGIAKSFAGDAGSGATASGLILGTPEYMSPEQARAETVDARSDIYALGIVLFELLTGELPFRGDTPMATLFKHMQEPPPLEGPRAARIPAAVIPVLRQALAKEAGNRYASVDEMGADLERARARLGVPSLGPEITGPQRVPSPPRTPAPPRPATAAPLPAPALDATTPMPTPVPTVAPTVVPTPAPRPAQAMTRQPTPPSGRRLPPSAARVSAPAASASAAERVAAPPRRPPPRWRVPWLVWMGVGALVAVAAGVGLLMRQGGADSDTAPAASEKGPSPTPNAATPTPGVAAPSTVMDPTVEPSAAVPLPSAVLASRPSVVATPRPALPTPVPATARPTPAPRTESTPAPPPPTLALKPYAEPSSPAEVAPAVTSPSTPPAPNAVSAAAGTLRIGAKPYAEIFVDGKSVGTTPLGVLTLSAGAHVIRFVHPDFQPLQRKVTIQAGEAARLTVDLPLDGIPK